MPRLWKGDSITSSLISAYKEKPPMLESQETVNLIEGDSTLTSMNDLLVKVAEDLTAVRQEIQNFASRLTSIENRL